LANITIYDLRPAGLDLLEDSESFLHELGEQESTVIGGAVIEINTGDINLNFNFQFNLQITRNVNNQQFTFNQAVTFTNRRR